MIIVKYLRSICMKQIFQTSRGNNKSHNMLQTTID